MAKPKSLLKTVSVDIAKRQHKCQHSSKHVISKGEKRLKIKNGRSDEYFCVECANSFLDQSTAALNKISQELNR